MSFSADVKTELAAIQPERGCCVAAQMYGMLECGHAFSQRAMGLQTEHPAVAARYASLLPLVCRVAEPPVRTFSSSRGTLSVTVDDPSARKRVLERFGHSGSEPVLRINRANFDCDDCAASYLRGAFLVSGAVSNPQTDYHLEFTLPYLKLSRDLVALCHELGLRVKTVVRKGNHVVYLKESEQIEDCLTLMGATTSSLEMMNVQMIKDIRNNANRVTNCEMANTDKAVAAASKQVAAIRKIQQNGGLTALPADLRELAQARLENPHLSLRELAECLSEPLTRSGIHHRLARILAYAEDIKE